MFFCKRIDAHFMNKIFTKLFYCFLLLLISIVGNAQIKFIESISPEKAGKNDYITLKLTVENASNIEQINPPSLSDFIILGGPSQESAVNNINGVVTQTLSLLYTLQPKKAGSFIIGPSTAIINGKTYKSNSIKVSVSNKASSNNGQNNPMAGLQSPFAGMDIFDEPKPQERYDDYILRNGETVQDKVSKNMQLKLQTSKSSCYVGEPILATYKLYTRLQSESNVTKNPSFNGFSVVDMMQQIDQSSYNKEKLNGREYNVYLIRKAQLYPLQAGTIELEAATLDNKVTFVKYENGIGKNGTMFSENVSLSSKPSSINVLPLPDKNKPSNFNGAVGNFTIEASVEKNNFSTDETGKLLITITGSGNMQLLTTPEIEWPTSFEVFETKGTDNINTGTIPLSGSKMFEIPFAVSTVGKYTIPKIGFSFFDPTARMYKTVSSVEIDINVSKGVGIAANNTSTKEKKAPMSLLNRIFSNRWLVVLFLAWLILTGVIIWMRKEKKKDNKINSAVVEEKIISTEVIPETISFNRNYLEKTADCLARENCIDFYTLINEEMKGFLESKYSLPKEIINGKTLGAALDKSGVDNSLILQTEALLSDIEWQLYTPFERNERLNEMYAKAQTIIQLHHRQYD